MPKNSLDKKLLLTKNLLTQNFFDKKFLLKKIILTKNYFDKKIIFYNNLTKSSYIKFFGVSCWPHHRSSEHVQNIVINKIGGKLFGKLFLQYLRHFLRKKYDKIYFSIFSIFLRFFQKKNRKLSIAKTDVFSPSFSITKMISTIHNGNNSSDFYRFINDWKNWIFFDSFKKCIYSVFQHS